MTATDPYRIETFDSLGSTNDVAMDRLKAGSAGDLFIVAREQTGGRGRQGRAWTSPPGNLYCSLALRAPAPLSVAPQLGFVAALSVWQAIHGLLPDDRTLAIKWPNDLLLDGAKCAGILLEGTMLADGNTACVIGIGVNCRSHPDGLAYPATNLAAANCRETQPAAVLAAIAAAMQRNLALWDRGRGFPAVRAAWLDHAAGLGTLIRVATPRSTLEGRFVGLDGAGRLLVATDEGQQTVDAGDVFLCGLPQPDMQI